MTDEVNTSSGGDQLNVETVTTEKDLVCILNGCQLCRLHRVICLTLRHEIPKYFYGGIPAHCRWCGQPYKTVQTPRVNRQ